ncbi:class II aldolase/adducin family protein [Desulfovibrio desulfuricans]|uniref:class II aldolase/adducin family protein n=1 Tax=Desulfovibrio desulfuricans TaxID=876 RepID=UPI001F2EFC8F|nr:class II aldolase/adducin family protein [Desulfovibrio desulfuricans]UIB00494.1 class II aldolase/adducin family protein [Desulfovibrio desulfuricans]
MSISSQRSTTAPIPEDQPSIPSEMVEEFRAVCRDAWKQGLLSGCNGNASRRLGSHTPGLVCITRSGAAKGRLTAADCCLMDIATGAVVSGGPASTESGMHLAIYRTRPDCNAILHTHPRRLLALSLRLAGRQEDFLRLPLFEAEVWRAKLGFAPALPPGTTELADAVALAASGKDAVWMAGHGLCCLGRTLAEALCLAEELEHLAALQILATV